MVIYMINVDNKLATKILLNDEYNILHFWETCLQYLKEKCLKEGHHFKPIEMLLLSKHSYITTLNKDESYPLVVGIEKIFLK